MRRIRAKLGFTMGVLGSTKERILKEIDRSPLHGYTLASRLGISLSSTYEHLKDLREGGFVDLKQEGRRRIYLLTDKGRLLLKALE